MAGTLQAKMDAKLRDAGIPFKAIQVYGRQIVVTSHCPDTAARWAILLASVATLRVACLESVDYAADPGNRVHPATVTVYRTYARI